MLLGPNIALSAHARAKGGGAPRITLSATAIDEDAASGTVVGALAVVGGSGSYTFSITADPDSKFAIDGSDLETDATLDYETATSHLVTIEADNGVDDPISKQFTIAVNNVFEAATLAALSLDTDEIEEGAAEDTVVGSLQDVTSGSTLSLIDDAGGRFKLSAGDIVAGAVATDYEAATSHNITIRETLADSSNSPRDSVIAIMVTESVAFSPASLYAASEVGVWYEPSPSTCFTDTGGTTPATVGDPVAYIEDLSGNGFHGVQATEANRPALRQTAGGVYYLEFDGVNDRVPVSTSAFALSSACVAARITKSATYQGILTNTQDQALNGDFAFVTESTTVNPKMFLLQSAGNGLFAAVRTNGGANSITLNADEIYYGDSTGFSGTSQLQNGAQIGRDRSAGVFCGMRFYGVVTVDRVLTSDERTNLEAYYADLLGITL